MRQQDTKSVITVSHLHGSGGSAVARELGRRLGFEVWDNEIVRRIASRYDLAESLVEAKDERVDSFVERMVGIFGAAGFEAAYQVPPPLWLNDARLVRMTRALIEEAAQRGRAVVVGRGGPCVLAGRRDVLHVFVFAPREARVRNVMAREGVDRKEAERRVAGMDRLRQDYLRTFYRADLHDPTLYHLLIDSSLWGQEATVDIVESAFRRLA